MPDGDRTGPMGMGPMTGRAAGYCTGSAVPGFMNAPGWRGCGGRGGGRGRGRRNWFYATGLTGWQRSAAGMPAFGVGQFVQTPPAVSKEQELDLLKQQVNFLSNSLEQIKQRLDELQAQPQP